MAASQRFPPRTGGSAGPRGRNSPADPTGPGPRLPSPELRAGRDEPRRPSRRRARSRGSQGGLLAEGAPRPGLENAGSRQVSKRRRAAGRRPPGKGRAREGTTRGAGPGRPAAWRARGRGRSPGAARVPGPSALQSGHGLRASPGDTRAGVRADAPGARRGPARVRFHGGPGSSPGGAAGCLGLGFWNHTWAADANQRIQDARLLRNSVQSLLFSSVEL